MSHRNQFVVLCDFPQKHEEKGTDFVTEMHENEVCVHSHLQKGRT